MERSFMEQVRQYLSSHKRKKFENKVLCCLGAAVVFCTVYVLILPAITMSNDVICGMEAHTHTESCWAMAPAQPEPELICGAENLEGIVLHSHNAYCYDNEGKLICPLQERESHTHSADCYQEHRTLICGETQEQGHVHTSACYARDRGELICGQEEAPAGHTHTDACYTVTSKEVLTCTTPESEGHTHTSACYTREGREVLTCGEAESDDTVDEEGNTIPGHHHSSGCYTTEYDEVLTCGESESEGHHHDSSCYTTEEERTLTCGQTESESEGHHHSDSCYEWTERLICHEEERPAGHVHDDSCYEITEELVCRKQELTPHQHSAICYDENGNLVCGLAEVIVHNHTADCVYIPETDGAEEVRTLICGKEEHIHTESCYVDVIHKLDEEYQCGFTEHLHGENCYNERGTLICTITEHVHTEKCLEKPEPEEPAPEGDNVVFLENSYEYTTEDGAFLVRFHVNGYAAVNRGGGAEPFHVSADDMVSAQPEHEEPGNEMEVEANGDGLVPLAGADESGLAPAEPAERPQESAPAARPEEDGGLGETDSQAPADEGEESGSVPDDSEDGGEYVDWSEPQPSAGIPELDPADVEFVVQPLPETDEEYQKLALHTGELSGDEEPLMLQVLAINATINGLELDLSECDIEVEVVPTEQLAAYMAESQVAAIDESGDPDDAEAGGDVSLQCVAFNSDTETGELVELASATLNRETVGGEAASGGGPRRARARTAAPANNAIMRFSMPKGSNSIALSVFQDVYPHYTVELYALRETPVRDEEGTLPFINTDNGGNNAGGNLPKNGRPNDTKVTKLHLDAGGNVIFKPELTEMYLPELHQFNPALEIEAPGEESTRLTVARMDSLKAKGLSDTAGHYEIKAVWVLPPNADPVIPEGGGASGWTCYIPSGTDQSYAGNVQNVVTVNSLDELYFTNNENSPGIGENVILLQDKTPADKLNEAYDGSAGEKTRYHTTVRLIYGPTEPSTHQNDAILYDYDISSGPNTGATVQTAQRVDDKVEGVGINDPSNYRRGSGTKFAVGNSNVGTPYGFLKWGNNRINKLNAEGPWGKRTNNSYGGCAFEMVKGYTVDGDVVFADGIDAPNLFGNDGKPTVGKTTVGTYTLDFSRQGNTYTLTGVRGTGAQNLDKFSHPGGYDSIWTNHFWPLDGVKGTDPDFGRRKPAFDNKQAFIKSDKKHDDAAYKAINDQEKDITYSETGNLPASDNGEDHNCYFGMNFAVDFTLSKEYIGPLEYYFYGDDDMWVFLTDSKGNQRLVCDIGGVHQSVGEYVNLWDYIPKEGRSQAEKYTLTFFYTERGASGSTCWMQYTVPNVANVPLDVKPDLESQPLRIEKKVEGNNKPATPQEYEFTLTLTNANESTQLLARRYSKDPKRNTVNPENGTVGYKEFPIVGREPLEFTLMDDEYLVVPGIPSLMTYEVQEKSYTDQGCSTSVAINGNVQEAPENKISGTVGSGATVTYTNGYHLELPETGGAGTYWYTSGGVLLMAAAVL